MLHISHITGHRPILTFLLLSGIGAIRELDEMNLKLGSLEELSGRRVDPLGLHWHERLFYGMACVDIARRAINDHRCRSPSNGSLLYMTNMTAEQISVTAH